jgi:hypothetical protein
MLQASDTQTQMRLRMLAVCAGAEGGLDTVIEALLGELARGEDDALRLIERSGLTDFLWGQVNAAYGYKADEPDFEDFAIALFQSAYARALAEDGAAERRGAAGLPPLEEQPSLGGLPSRRCPQRYQDLLKIADDLAARDFRTLMSIDHFELIDRQIIREIVQAMSAQSVSAPEVLGWVRERRQSHWYSDYEDIYQAIGFATEFQQALAEANLTMTSPSEGVQRYVTSLVSGLDQLYRKFIYHMQKAARHPCSLISMHPLRTATRTASS